MSYNNVGHLSNNIKRFFYKSTLKPDAQSYERTLNRDSNKSISNEDKT
jgi:hypothetical protein